MKENGMDVAVMLVGLVWHYFAPGMLPLLVFTFGFTLFVCSFVEAFLSSINRK